MSDLDAIHEGRQNTRVASSPTENIGTVTTTQSDNDTRNSMAEQEGAN